MNKVYIVITRKNFYDESLFELEVFDSLSKALSYFEAETENVISDYNLTDNYEEGSHIIKCSNEFVYYNDYDFNEINIWISTKEVQ